MNTFKLVITYVNGNTDTAFCNSMATAISTLKSMQSAVGDEIVGVEIGLK